MKMMKINVRQKPLARFLTIAGALVVVLADQLSKIAVSGALGTVGASRTVIPGVLDFTYVLNSGATGGILSGHRWVFMTISSVVIVAMIAYVALGAVKTNLSAVAIAMIAGGGIGNMIDRVARGTVVDFIDVTLVDFFPFNTVFNVADVFVCVGCCLLVLSMIISEVKEAKEKKKKEAASAAE